MKAVVIIGIAQESSVGWPCTFITAKDVTSQIARGPAMILKSAYQMRT